MISAEGIAQKVRGRKTTLLSERAHRMSITCTLAEKQRSLQMTIHRTVGPSSEAVVAGGHDGQSICSMNKKQSSSQAGKLILPRIADTAFFAEIQTPFKDFKFKSAPYLLAERERERDRRTDRQTEREGREKKREREDAFPSHS